MLSSVQRRILIWVPASVALLASLAWLFMPRPIAVDVARVAHGPLQVTIAEEGEAQVHDVFMISAPASGLLRRIELDAGDPVVANHTVIARIEPSVSMLLDERTATEARAALDAASAARDFARAQIRRSEAERDFAATEWQRLQALAPAKSISRNDVDAAERRAKTASAAVEEARAAFAMRASEYRQARARLLNPGQRGSAERDCNCLLVRSPVSGTVLQVLQRSEAAVMAGTPLLQIGDPQDLEIHVDLLSADAVLVQPGQRVSIDGWGGAKTLRGAVRRIEPFGYSKVSALGIEEQRVNVIIDLLDPPECWRALNHGYQVEPHIVIWESADALQVPMAALFRDDEQWALFTVESGRARLRHVQIDHHNETHAEIVSGIAAGVTIVLHPNDRLSDGVRVVARDRAAR